MIIQEKNRKIYYQPKTKTGYLIQPKNEKQYRFYENRYFIAIILFLLFYNFLNNFILTTLIIATFCISTEILFRKKFLPSLTIYHNMKEIEKVPYYIQLANRHDKNKSLLLLIAYALLGIVVIIYAITSFTPTSYLEYLLQVLRLCVGIGAIVFSYQHFKAYRYKTLGN